MKLRIRKASLKDAEMTYDWRNDERVRHFFFDPNPIAYNDHLAWYENALRDKKRAMYIVEDATDAVGSIRFDKIDEVHAEVSIYMAPDKQGQGFGAAGLKQAMEIFLAEYPHIKQINARVLPDNIISQKLFLKTGFQLFHYEYRYSR